MRDEGDRVVSTAEEASAGAEAAEIVGITYRQLDYWARTDLIRPSLADATGSGSRRRYSYRDLLELKVIKNLLDAGIKLESVRDAFAYLRDHLGEDVTTVNLVIKGRGSRARAYRRGAGRPAPPGPGRAEHPAPGRREERGRRGDHRAARRAWARRPPGRPPARRRAPAPPSGRPPPAAGAARPVAGCAGLVTADRPDRRRWRSSMATWLRPWLLAE